MSRREQEQERTRDSRLVASRTRRKMSRSKQICNCITHFSPRILHLSYHSYHSCRCACSKDRIRLTHEIARANKSVADAKMKLQLTIKELTEEVDTPIPQER